MRWAEEEASAPESPGGDGPGAPVEVMSLLALEVGCCHRTLSPATAAEPFGGS
jgi:hypothetical protein